MNELIDHHSVAKWLGVTTRTLRTWTRYGKIPAPVSIGRKRLWIRSVLEAWLCARAEHGDIDSQWQNASDRTRARRGRRRLPA